MSLSTTIQNAIITQLGNDANIASKFTGKITKGMGRNVNLEEAGRGIRVFLSDEVRTFIDTTSARSENLFNYIVVVFFYEPDDVLAEDTKATYADWVITAILNDDSISGYATSLELGQIQYKFDPAVDGLHFIGVPLSILSIQ